MAKPKLEGLIKIHKIACRGVDNNNNPVLPKTEKEPAIIKFFGDEHGDEYTEVMCRCFQYASAINGCNAKGVERSGIHGGFAFSLCPFYTPKYTSKEAMMAYRLKSC